MWEAVRADARGVKEIVTAGVSVTMALANLVGSAALVAVTVAVCAAEMVAGAV